MNHVFLSVGHQQQRNLFKCRIQLRTPMVKGGVWFSAMTRRVFSTRRVELRLRYAVAIPSSGVRAINIVAALQLWNS